MSFKLSTVFTQFTECIASKFSENSMKSVKCTWIIFQHWLCQEMHWPNMAIWGLAINSFWVMLQKLGFRPQEARKRQNMEISLHWGAEHNLASSRSERLKIICCWEASEGISWESTLGLPPKQQRLNWGKATMFLCLYCGQLFYFEEITFGKRN